MKKSIFLLLLISLVACSCGDDLMTGGVQYDRQGEGVFICNEGNFMYGNASLSSRSRKTRTTRYFTMRIIFHLEMSCQSMSIISGHGIVVVNNSGKVFVIDINTFKYLGVIKGLTSPRYIQQVSDDKIYISDIYSPFIAIADPKTLEVTGHVYMDERNGPGKVNGTEQMVMHGNYVYVCSWSYNNKIYKIDARTDEVVDSIQALPSSPIAWCWTKTARYGCCPTAAMARHTGRSGLL